MLKVVGASRTQTKLSQNLIIFVTIFSLVVTYFGVTIRNEADGKYAASALWSKDFGLRVQFFGQNNDPSMVMKGVARAYHRTDSSKNGLATLEIETQAEYPDIVQARAAGYLEGSLTWQTIYWHWKKTVKNACDGRSEFCDQLRKYLQENTNIIKQIANQKDNWDPFWHQVNLFYVHLKGLEDGWRYGVQRSRQDIDIPSIDFIWMNIIPDLKDFGQKLNTSRNLYSNKPPLYAAFVKIVNTNPIDFVLAQVTSQYYGSMFRIQKRYNFGFHETGNFGSALVKGKVVEFTSYPGSIHSQDDFYKVIKRNTKTEMVIAGTESQNKTKILLEKFMEGKDKVFRVVRVMVANRLANNSKHWYEVFLQNNSGIGNKQWLVITTNETSIEFGVVKQLSNIVVYNELSSAILSTGCWFGTSFSFLQSSAEITRIDDSNDINTLHDRQWNVTNFNSMTQMMQGLRFSSIDREMLIVGGMLSINKTFLGEMIITTVYTSGFIVASGISFVLDLLQGKLFRWSNTLTHQGNQDVRNSSASAVNWVWK